MSQSRRSVSKRARDTEQPADVEKPKSAPLRYLLPQNVAFGPKATRTGALNANKALYEWTDPSDWLPPGLKAPPAKEIGIAGVQHVLKVQGGTMLAAIQMEVKSLSSSVTSLLDVTGATKKQQTENPFHEFTELYPSALEGICSHTQPLPACVNKTDLDQWASDKEFGRQQVSGMNPLMIRKCPPLKELRKKFPVTEADMKGVLPEGITLARLEEQGNRLWIVDFVGLDGIEDIALPPPTGNTWFYVPIVLLWTDKNDDMMPLAIQLQQDPKKSSVYTPNDDAGLWTLVKSAVGQTEVSYHACCEHISGTHYIFETFYVAAMRTLSKDHPIHQVFWDSFWLTCAVDVGARTDLMSPKGQLPTFFAQGYEGMKEMVKRQTKGIDFSKYDLRVDLQKRGVQDLPKYYWKEDSLEGLEAWEAFITTLVDNLYDTDADVVADYEIQNWATECAAAGMSDFTNMPIKDISKIYTKADLISLLSCIFYNVTFRHCSLHMAQFDYVSLPVNAPNGLRRQVPKKNTARDGGGVAPPITISKQELVDHYFPVTKDIITQVSFFRGVTFPPYAGYAVGQFTDQFIPAGEPGHYLGQAMVQEFQGKLKVMSERIKLRNANLTIPYNYTDPEVVWRSMCM